MSRYFLNLQLLICAQIQSVLDADTLGFTQVIRSIFVFQNISLHICFISFKGFARAVLAKRQ